MATKHRLYIHSAAGAGGVAYERWDTGLLPDSPVPGLVDLANLPQSELDGQQFASYADMQAYANSRGETLHEVDSTEQAIRVISGQEAVPGADSDFSAYLPWVVGAAAAWFFFLRRKRS